MVESTVRRTRLREMGAYEHCTVYQSVGFARFGVFGISGSCN